jgi:plasmid stabilization system protein ParE
MILFSPDAVEDVERLRSFLDQNNPGAAQRALASIWAAIDRLQEFPDLGMATGDAYIRQIVVRFGASGYIVRYGTAARHGPDFTSAWVEPWRNPSHFAIASMGFASAFARWATADRSLVELRRTRSPSPSNKLQATTHAYAAPYLTLL